MDEENKVVEETGTEEQEKAEQIVIEQPGKLKKALKWIIGGVVVVASAITGVLLFNKKKDDDNDEGSAESENPTED